MLVLVLVLVLLTKHVPRTRGLKHVEGDDAQD